MVRRSAAIVSPEYIQNQGLQPHQYYLLATRFVPENNALFIIKSFLKAETDKPIVVLGKNYYRSTYEDEIMKIQDQRCLLGTQRRSETSLRILPIQLLLSPRSLGGWHQPHNARSVG